jgi:hypothetical protein
MASAYDCVACGACCFNPPDNVAEEFSDYIEVGPRDAIRSRPALLKRYTYERDGRLHMQLLPDHRCKALLGAIGRRVRCSIYHVRPAPCRRVEAGSELCRRYRRLHGLEAEKSS